MFLSRPFSLFFQGNKFIDDTLNFILVSSDTSINYCNTRGRRQQQRKPFQPSTKQKPATKCSCCDTTHANRACSAYGKACNKCGKSGHFARVCRSKPNDGKVRYVSHYDPTDGTAEMFVGMVKNAHTATDNKWTQKLRVDNCTISFKLDTGSDVSIISEKQYQCIKPAPKLEKSSTVMTPTTVGVITVLYQA